MGVAMTLEEKGIEIGEKRGEKRGKQEVARKMFESGMAVETIKQLTGLSDKDLKALRSQVSG